MSDAEIKIKSLAKALRVLECFISEPELGVTEISTHLGLNKSNVCDILTTFQALGYVEQRQNTGNIAWVLEFWSCHTRWLLHLAFGGRFIRT